MKRLFLLLALLLKLGPCFQDGTLSLTSGSVMAQSMGDESTCFLICSATVTIAGPCESVFSIPCPGVTITSPPYVPLTTPEPPTMPEPPIPNPCQGPTADPCACFNYCGAPTGPPPTTPPPTTPKAPPRVNCAGSQAETISVETTADRNNPAWANVINLMKNRLVTPGFSDKEYGAVLQAKVVGGSTSIPIQYSVTNGGVPFEGDQNSVHITLPPCTTGYLTTFAAAIVHTHPQGNTFSYTGPSAMDFYYLAYQNSKCPMTKKSFSIAFNGDEYVLSVNDRARSLAFLDTYPSYSGLSQATNGFNIHSQIGFEFEEANRMFKAQGYSTNDAHGMATAYILNQYNTGITLLKKDSDGKFKQINVTATTSGGTTTYTITMCK